MPEIHWYLARFRENPKKTGKNLWKPKFCR